EPTAAILPPATAISAASAPVGSTAVPPETIRSNIAYPSRDGPTRLRRAVGDDNLRRLTKGAAVPTSVPILDHVVVDVRDRMDEAAAVYRALGFQLTPRGHHTLGSMNHLAMLATDYLELLGFGAGGASRPELAPFPIGLN